MKTWVTLGFLLGLSGIVTLVAWQGFDTIAAALASLGWGVFLLPLVFLPHLALAALSWRLLFRPKQTPPLASVFRALSLYSEPFVIAVAPGHRFEQMEVVQLKDLHQERYLRRTNCEFGEVFHDLLRERGVEPSCLYRSEREGWIQAMVLAGLGFAVVPRFAITVPGLVIRPLIDPSLGRTVNLVTVRGRFHSPAVGAFVGEARRHEWTA